MLVKNTDWTYKENRRNAVSKVQNSFQSLKHTLIQTVKHTLSQQDMDVNNVTISLTLKTSF
jgi:hypothetical protein